MWIKEHGLITYFHSQMMIINRVLDHHLNYSTAYHKTVRAVCVGHGAVVTSFLSVVLRPATRGRAGGARRRLPASRG